VPERKDGIRVDVEGLLASSQLAERERLPESIAFELKPPSVLRALGHLLGIDAHAKMLI
jgi:hypothetical protein